MKYWYIVHTISCFWNPWISLSSQDWSKIKKPVSQSVQWPERRFAHAASHITGTVFVMIGGVVGDRSTLSDVWLCDTNQWNKVLSLSHMNLVVRRGLPNRVYVYGQGTLVQLISARFEFA